jgi:hypothetical protein
MMLVTLEQASDHLRRDTDADDADLALKIETASELVVDYLKDAATFLDSSGEVPTDSAGNPIGVPARVRQATLLMVGELYKDRDGQQEGAVPTQWGYGYLPQGVTAVLYSMRVPTVA